MAPLAWRARRSLVATGGGNLWNDRLGLWLFRNPYEFRNPAALSERQRDVIALASRGQDNRAIGMTLGMARSTVASHLSAAIAKLDLENRAAVARYLNWECGEVDELAGGDPNVRTLALEPDRNLDRSVLTDAEQKVTELAAASNACLAASSSCDSAHRIPPLLEPAE